MANLNPKIDELIYHLQGTSMTLGEACENLGINEMDLTLEDLQEIDNWLFKCDNCGWWYDVGERVYLENSDYQDDNICSYCAEDIED